MPVDLRLPLMLAVAVLVTALVFVVYGRRVGLITLGLQVLALSTAAAVLWLPSWRLARLASDNDPVAQYRLSRWYLNSYLAHSGFMNQTAALYWLTRSADNHYPPAMYALGVSYCIGRLVPRPANWTGTGGNVYRQPAVGQQWKELALQSGYMPPNVDDLVYYNRIYRTGW